MAEWDSLLMSCLLNGGPEVRILSSPQLAPAGFSCRGFVLRSVLLSAVLRSVLLLSVVLLSVFTQQYA